MADPITILTVASTAFSAVSSISGGIAAKKQGKYNAAVARQQAEADADKQSREARYRAGLNRNAAFSSGLQFEGSALDILEANAINEEVDRRNILQGGDIRAAGYEYEGEQSQRQGFMQAGSTLLSGGAKAYGGFASSPTKVTTSGPLPWRSAGNVNPAGGFY